tara:strand:- start:17702 stop:17911 length:210 start_codon:yes stop_codon:yes gene_type:complete
MKNHWFWMVVACLAPILLIFLLPSFGVTSGSAFFLFMAIFFVAHLFMIRVHSSDQINNQNDKKSKDSHH